MRHFKNYNEAYQNCDIISKTEDKFTQETTVQTNHILLDFEALDIKPIDAVYEYDKFFNGDYKPNLISRFGLRVDDELIVPGINLNMDIQYKSSQKGEEFSIVLRNRRYENVIIININGHTNIRLEMDENRLDVFPIANGDFIKCCEAKTLSFQERKDDKVSFEFDCDDFILFFQAMYNEVIDNGKYQDAAAILKSKCQKELEEFKAWNDQKNFEKEKNKRDDKLYGKAIWEEGIGGSLLVIGIIILCVIIGLKRQNAGFGIFLSIASIVGGLILTIVGAKNKSKSGY